MNYYMQLVFVYIAMLYLYAALLLVWGMRRER